ncbi:hypothetical protein AB0G04_38115 [Actinoplanes sp. NPDC023801]|uniref:hypothetical protein n=1 Tax=Actinoplanes sp. NPDC023801 TaxID=3154595 RepID=UPI0033F5E60E
MIIIDCGQTTMTPPESIVLMRRHDPARHFIAGNGTVVVAPSPEQGAGQNR